MEGGSVSNNLLTVPKFDEVAEGEQKTGGNKELKAPTMKRSTAINFDDGESNVDITKIVSTIKNEAE